MKVPNSICRILQSKKQDKVHLLEKHPLYVTSDWGLSARVYIFSRFVVKFSSQNRSDFRYIEKMRNQPRVIARHFPNAMLVGRVMIQERCSPNETLFEEYENKLSRLFDRFGIYDMHSGNVGWRHPKTKPVPVFIDVESREKKKFLIPHRSWF